MGSALVSISSRQTVEADVSSPLRERSATGMVLLGVGLLAIALNLRIGVVSVPPELGLALASVVLDRLALGAHARYHRAHLAHTHPIRDLNLDLLVVDNLGDLADQPA